MCIQDMPLDPVMCSNVHSGYTDKARQIFVTLISKLGKFLAEPEASVRCRPSKRLADSAAVTATEPGDEVVRLQTVEGLSPFSRDRGTLVATSHQGCRHAQSAACYHMPQVETGCNPTGGVGVT